ncbi:hypothetical protein AB0I28_09715 [Phytomonospora sp. NPDC050363]|uniref:hypothetical protein n=1 Tax=Phytomonospora sp. NPDC050363 TaxID=3155642 RepID=UPI0033DBD918
MKPEDAQIQATEEAAYAGVCREVSTGLRCRFCWEAACDCCPGCGIAPSYDGVEDCVCDDFTDWPEGDDDV